MGTYRMKPGLGMHHSTFVLSGGYKKSLKISYYQFSSFSNKQNASKEPEIRSLQKNETNPQLI